VLQRSLVAASANGAWSKYALGTTTSGYDAQTPAGDLFSIDGVEITQSIQYYKADQHLQDPNDRGPDNSLALVSGKATYVRTYVHAVAQTQMLKGVLHLERRNGTIWSPAGTYKSVSNVEAKTNAAYQQQRESLGATVAFKLPAEVVNGDLRLKILRQMTLW